MGKVKLTLPLGNKKLIEWVLQAAKLTPLDKYFLVVRPEDKEIIKIGKKWGAEIVFNPDFRKGMSTSIKKALLKINTQEVKGFFLILGDQPLITSKIINKLIKLIITKWNFSFASFKFNLIKLSLPKAIMLWEGRKAKPKLTMNAPV